MIRSEFRLNLSAASIVVASVFTVIAALSNTAMFFMMGFFMPFIYLTNMRYGNGLKFYSALPVKRSAQVLAVTCVTILLETLQLLEFAFATIIARLFFSGDEHAFVLNFVALGVTCVAFGVINITSLPFVFNTSKNLPQWVFALLCLLYSFVFAAIFVPLSFIRVAGVEILNGYETEWLWIRVIVFATGIVLMAILTYCGYIISYKKFKKENI